MQPPSAQSCLHGHIHFLFIEPLGTALLCFGYIQRLGYEREGQGPQDERWQLSRRLDVTTAESVWLQHEPHPEWEMPQEKFERLHVHPPALQGISSNAGGKKCTAMAVHNWDSDSRALMFRKEAGDRRSPQAAGKSVQTLGDARRHFLPLVGSGEEKKTWVLPSIP